MAGTKLRVIWYGAWDFLAGSFTAFLWMNYYPNSSPENSLHKLFMSGGIGIVWLIAFSIAGAYAQSLYQKSRLQEFLQTLFIGLPISTLIYWFLLYTDTSVSFSSQALSFSFWNLISFSVGRSIILWIVKRQLQTRQIVVRTLIIGNTKQSVKLFKKLNDQNYFIGYHLMGFIAPQQDAKNGLSKWLPYWGDLDAIQDAVQKHNIEQVIITIPKKQQEQIENCISLLSPFQIAIKLAPETLDILSGSVRTTNVFRDVLIDLDPSPLPAWQRNIKRLMDLTGAFVLLIILFPVLLLAAIRTYFSSKGSIIYAQERLGLQGNKFVIYKFRSMIEDAEPNGPALSSDHDPRITSWGKFMRKWRIDELPQLWNIIKGDMSFVGPRPERAYYVDAISKKTPYYKYLLRMRPGLTSWGMVQFGYASSVEEMIERMQYDLAYVENASLLLDIKIMLHTFLIIAKGKGK